AEKIGGTGLVLDGEPDGFRGRLAGAGPIGAGLRLLPRHRRVEALEIDGNAALSQRILSEIERKSIGVVKLESRFAVEPVAFAHPLGRVGEKAQAPREGPAEARLLQPQRL